MDHPDLKRRVLVLLDEDFTITEIAERCYDSEGKIRCIIRDEMRSRGAEIAGMRSRLAALYGLASVLFAATFGLTLAAVSAWRSS